MEKLNRKWSSFWSLNEWPFAFCLYSDETDHRAAEWAQAHRQNSDAKKILDILDRKYAKIHSNVMNKIFGKS